MDLDAGSGPTDIVDRDVPCERCRYNLRGLNPDGLCPECGRAIGPSLAADSRRRVRRPPPSPWLAREVIEGAAFGLGSLFLVIGAAVAPDAWLRLHTPGRAALMSLLAAAWTFTLVSAWKLTREDAPTRNPTQRQSRRRCGPVCLATRAIALSWAGGAFWFAWETKDLPDRGPPLQDFVLYATAFGGVALSSLLALRLAALLDRVRKPYAAAFAIGLVMFAPFVMFTTMPLRGFGPSSLEFLMQSPLPPYGPGELWYVMTGLRVRRPERMLPILAPGVLYAVLLVRVAIAYTPLLKRTGGVPALATEPQVAPGHR